MNRRKSTLGRPRAVPLSPPVRMLNCTRRSPRLGTLGLSAQKSGQKSSAKKIRLYERLRETLGPSQFQQLQQMNCASNIVPKKNVSRRLEMKGPALSEQLLGASNAVGVEDIPQPPCQPSSPIAPLQPTPVTSSLKSKRKSLPRKVVHNLKTKDISNKVRKTMGTGIPLPKYYSSQIKPETKLPPCKYPSSKKMQEKKFPLPKVQPSPSNCSMDCTARFVRDEARVVTSTPAVKTTTPFGAVKTLIAQPHDIERMYPETSREIENLIQKQNNILEDILQEQRAQTGILNKCIELFSERQTCHGSNFHPMSPPKFNAGPSEMVSRENCTPVKMSAIKGRKSLPVHVMQCQTNQLLGTPRLRGVKYNAKATPRTQRTALDRIAQEQENLLANLDAP